ncbi:methyl-accepting chemotaxis protein [Suilimivivens aceti]|uniref:Methyl-accepting chemotaxis protein n=1 Tax=Suilimivivens aceti TaxID=2981774 RepID=A0ABT2T1P0_9FIRM|nr:methyl-accepting chemotaxis protein [Suilimivivens aceti]MCU6744142.1 methyl-accepting chemotaxis protein [Suilimivivens aceti]SCH56198.1 Methyl-accepting chemotaxis protein 4 [uncultured Clostridium sp.]
MKKKMGYLQVILMIGCIPMIAAIVALTVYASAKMKNELIDSTYLRLKACSTSVEQYFTWDIREDILEKDDISYQFIDSLQEEHIEQTLFMGDERFITSIVDEDGKRIEGTKADPKVWETVKTGNDYAAYGMKINGERYYVYYMPVRSDDGEILGMAFSGERESAVRNAISGMLRSLVLLAGCMIVLFTAILVYLSFKIRKPLLATAEYIDCVANGDLSGNLEVKSVIREVTTLIRASAALKDKLNSIVTEVDGHAMQLDNNMESLNVLASASSKGANQIRQAIDELSKTAVSLAENVQSVNTSMMEMGNNVTAIHSETVTLNENSDKMDHANRNASESMNLVLTSSHTSSAIIEEMIVQVKATNEAIASISKAVELISDITSQTNLLSLNASIEAARAGQAGRGFAVVATEIKQLADQSSQGAAAIKNIVDDILEKSNKSVELTERMRTLAEKEQADIGSAKTGFDTLSQIIEANVATAGTIAEKTKNLEELKQTIINNITELSAISEENAASNEEVTANVSSIAESIDRISEDTGMIKKVSAALEEQMKYFKKS